MVIAVTDQLFVRMRLMTFWIVLTSTRLIFLKYYSHNGIKTNNNGLSWFNRCNPLEIMDLKQKQKFKMQMKTINIDKEKHYVQGFTMVFCFLLLFAAQNKISILCVLLVLIVLIIAGTNMLLHTTQIIMF